MFFRRKSETAPASKLDREGRDVGWYAAMDGDLNTLQNRLQSDLSIDHADKGGASLLWIAAHDGQVEAVKYLLARGASVDAKDTHGNAALWHTTRQAVSPTPQTTNFIGILELLLAAGADPDHKNKTGKTAPCWAGPMVGNAVNRDEVQSLFRAYGYSGDFT